MKKNCLLFILLFSANTLVAQHVGIGTNTPAPSAKLEINSANSGLLIPRMTAANRTAIASPATGLLVFQTDAPAGFYYYTGTAWVQLNTNANAWNTTGNSGTDFNTNFIGTTDAVDLKIKVNNQLAGMIERNAGVTTPTTSFGYQTFDNKSLSSGNNTAFGFQIMRNQVGGFNTAMGIQNMMVTQNGHSNNAFGYKALHKVTDGNNNVGMGNYAAYENTTGIYNVALGNSALYTNTTGSGNVAVGYEALAIDADSDGQVAIGRAALRNNSTGFGNLAIGDSAMVTNNEGSFNVGIGKNVLVSNTTGVGNTAIGLFAMNKNLAGFRNVGVGILALANNLDGGANIGVGAYTLYNNTNGSLNIAIGENALYADTYTESQIAIGISALGQNSGGENNLALGTFSLRYNTFGSNNVAIGFLSQGGLSPSGTIGMNNISVGKETLFRNYSGANNVAIGRLSIHSNELGSNNIALGDSSLYLNFDGINNIAMGTYVLNKSNGSNNVAIGHLSMNDNTGGNQNTALGAFSNSNNTTGSANTAVGYGAGPSAGYTNLQNASAIGAFAQVRQDNSLILGSIAGISTNNTDTKVGIGTATPSSKLNVVGAENTSPLVQISQFGTNAPALKIAASSGNNGGIELENAAIKVSGTNRSVFQITAVTGPGGNASGNLLNIPNSTFANNPNDMLIVTPVYETGTGVYCNFPIGVWWNGSNWVIFNQTLAAMPNNAKFNVMVVKQ